MAKRRKSKKKYYTDPFTGQKKEVGATYNPITGKKIPKGYIEEPITGRLIKKTKSKNSSYGSIFDVPQRTNRRRQRPLTNEEKHFQFLVVVIALCLFGIYFLWQWIKLHIWQSVLFGILFVTLFLLLLWKVPKFRFYMGGDFWNFLGKLFAPPPESDKDRRIKEGKYERFLPLNQSEKNKLMDKVGNKCEYCGTNYFLDVHHIIPRSEGGSNKYNNLVVLCKNCHGASHGGGISKARLKGIAIKR